MTNVWSYINKTKVWRVKLLDIISSSHRLMAGWRSDVACSVSVVVRDRNHSGLQTLASTIFIFNKHWVESGIHFDQERMRFLSNYSLFSDVNRAQYNRRSQYNSYNNNNNNNKNAASVTLYIFSRYSKSVLMIQINSLHTIKQHQAFKLTKPSMIIRRFS